MLWYAFIRFQTFKTVLVIDGLVSNDLSVAIQSNPLIHRFPFRVRFLGSQKLGVSHLFHLYIRSPHHNLFS